ncbi:MAG: 30S ribosomal protein S6 [Candidatus Omnitrophica bacterium]|nr:30S ribosomal protein S6 [Candidatus Omnitrophota bacterium]
MDKITKKYELMLILDAHLSKDDKDAIIKSVNDVINKSGGKVINTQVWFEKQKFTFEIKKKSEGTYYLINFAAEKPAIAKIRAYLRLNEKILRSLILEVAAHATKEAVQASIN